MKLIIATLQLGLLAACQTAPRTHTAVPELHADRAAKLATDLQSEKEETKQIRTISEQIDYKDSLIQ